MANFQELNLNKLLYRDTQDTSDVLPISAEEQKFLNTESIILTPSESFVSGEIQGDLILLDGLLRSKNFVTGVSGWQIDADGNAEFQTIVARVDWDDVTDGTGTKPDDNATLGATAGTDLKDSGAIVLDDSDVKNVDTFTAGEAIAQYSAVRIASDSKIYKSSSVAEEFTLRHIGFTLEAIASAGTGKVQLIGYLTGLSLTAGSPYYLTDGDFDQQQIAVNTSNNVPGPSGGDYYYGQSFTTGAGIITLDWIEIFGKKVNLGTSIYFEIFAVDGSGFPTGSVLGTTDTLQPQDQSVGQAWHILHFSTPIHLSAETKYAMVIMPQYITTGMDAWDWRSTNDGSAYTDGTMFRFNFGGTWVDLEDDFSFKTGVTNGDIATTEGTTTEKVGISTSTSLLRMQDS